jgi:uncharacterized protein YtpQ (UPF0354 family)
VQELRLFTLFLLLASASLSAAESHWRHELSVDRMSEGRFTEIFVEAARELDQIASAEVVEPLYVLVKAENGNERDVYLGNVYRNLAPDPKQRAVQVMAFMEAIAPYMEPEQITVNHRGLVLPVIRHESYLNLDTDVSLITDPFVGDMRVFYVLDWPNRTEFMSQEHLDLMELTRDELRELALQNLAMRVDRVALRQMDEMVLVGFDGNYETSLLLLDSMWRRFTDESGGILTAAAPARDVLVYTSSSRPEAIATLQDIADRFAEEGGYAISSRLIEWVDGHWRLKASE